MSAQVSLLVTKEVESMLKKGAIQKKSVKKRPILDQPVFSRKKGWGQQTCNKHKKSECIHSLFSLQNGKLAFAKGHTEREILHLQNRPEGCLLTIEFHYIKNIKSTSGFIVRPPPPPPPSFLKGENKF